VTWFFLAWLAKEFPELVREAQQRGHEVASHGYGHRLVYTQSQQDFAEDIRTAKNILEDITGEPILGYRAPGFSIVESTPWAFEELCAAGYRYDTSIFPAKRGHGGIVSAPLEPHVIQTRNGSLVEFPVSVAEIASKRICFFGGGYLRLFPYFLIRYMTNALNRGGRPVFYYIHPREIDPDHPRLSMGWKRHFKSYVNLSTTLPKLQRLINEYEFVPFRDLLPTYSAV